MKSFRNLATIFKILAKIVISNFYKNENIGEHSICNFSTKFGGGGGQGNCSGRKRNNIIAKSFTETLGTILGKFCDFKISPKMQQ